MASITLENLNKTYPNGFVSVKNLSLHIEDGEFITFFGPSGCGKSTILRMIGGMEDITSGEIYEAQKQRVALGRAVVCKPKVLLVDEDFARQNEHRRKEMMRDIRRINKELGITVLYVTNKRGETEIAGQKVISMRDGEIVDIKKI